MNPSRRVLPLLLMTLLALGSSFGGVSSAWAHGDEDHGQATPAAPAADLPIRVNRAAEDAWYAADLRPHWFNDHFLVSLQVGHTKCSLALTATNHHQGNVFQIQRQRWGVQQGFQFQQGECFAGEFIRG